MRYALVQDPQGENMELPKEDYTIFEDQDDYIEDIKDQFRRSIRRYTMYCKMFGHPSDWKEMKNEWKKFMHYELEKTFHDVVIRESSKGGISMYFHDEEGLK